MRLTLFASEMSKGTVSAAMGMLQMLIFTVGIELSKHAYELGGNGLFSLFNLLGWGTMAGADDLLSER